jgi:hypothetical protein
VGSFRTCCLNNRENNKIREEMAMAEQEKLYSWLHGESNDQHKSR